MFIITSLFLIPTSYISVSYAATDEGGHAGTPPGFYDDITPEDIEKEEEEPQGEAYQTFTDEPGEFMHPPYERTPPTKNYAEIYNSLEEPNFSYQHDIDPDQYYDMKDTTWSVYPLFRLTSPIYFKSITIEPGYYLLTPREHQGDWFLLFKQNGLVKYIIPVYDRDYTPEMFYDKNIPKAKETMSQKTHSGFLNFIGKIKSTKRQEPVQTYLEVNDLENYFLSIIIYYGSHRYSTIFRTIKL